MDNPWANGWSDEPEKPTFNDLKPTSITTPSWPASHAHSTSEGSQEEADLSSPSWSAGADIKWAEPSQIQGSLWSQTTDSDHLDAWGSSTYKDITLGRLTPDPPSPQGEDDSDEYPPLSPAQQEEISPIPSPEKEITITPPRVPSPSLESTHFPPSPDAFGSFETAVKAGDDDPWSSSATAFPPDNEEVDQWGSTWTAPKVEEDETTAKVLPDEWEVARQRKENMDRQVPPELLASILSRCEETSHDLWPNPEAANDSDGNDFRSNLYSGMDGVEGLTALMNRVAPEEMILPPTIPFGKTFTAKFMAGSIRLSRHAPLTRLSPMSQLMASKGSTAWETSVKSRPEIVQDDLPVGWRVVESDKEAPAQATDAGKGKKIGGGLLSFWGRKAVANVIVDAKHERSMPLVHAASASPRSSLDTAKPPAVTVPASKPISPTIASTSVPPSIVPPPSSPSTTISAPSLTTKTAQPDLFDPVEAQSVPSAVSRFLGRFSRTKNTTPNQQHSLALSSDDLEFLSDFVPSASDDHDRGDSELNALSSMIQSSPLPTKLPPPLAPPPKPPSMNRPVSLSGVPKPQTNALNDHALFSLSAGPLVAPASTLHPPLPPFLSPTSSAMSASTMTSPPPTSFTSLSSDSSPVDNSLSSFILPPPPSSSRSQSPGTISAPATSRSSFTKSTSTPPLLPPSSRTHTPKPSLITPPTTFLMSDSFDDGDDDEFSDFHSPAPRPYHQSAISQYDSPQSSKRPFFSQQPSNSSKPMSSSFDDFDDFVSSPMRSPSPPIPPAKPPPRQNDTTSPKVTSNHQRKVSGADHQRTANSFGVDLFGDTSSTKPQQNNLTLSSSKWMDPARLTPSNGLHGIASLSPPPAQRNIGSSSFSQSLMSFSSNSAQSPTPSFGTFNAAPSSAPAPSASKPSSVGGQGGLSAQDLSFFEGL